MKFDDSFMMMIATLSATNGVNHFLEIRNRLIVAKEKLKLHEVYLGELNHELKSIKKTLDNNTKTLNKIQSDIDKIEAKISSLKKQ